jgi:hypothetical protein
MRAPVTAALFAVLVLPLSGCMAYDAASTVVSAGTSVVTTAVEVPGDAIGAVIGDSDNDKKRDR